MKRLILFAILFSTSAFAQNFSPSASAQSITSPSASLLNNFVAPSSILNQTSPATAGPTNLDLVPAPITEDPQVLNQTNTAPTPIPENTPLIIDPTLDSIRQAQEAQEEQINPTPPPRPNDTETSPGSVTGGAIGGGAGGTTGGTFDTNGGTGINNNAPINNIP